MQLSNFQFKIIFKLYASQKKTTTAKSNTNASIIYYLHQLI